MPGQGLCVDVVAERERDSFCGGSVGFGAEADPVT